MFNLAYINLFSVPLIKI